MKTYFRFVLTGLLLLTFPFLIFGQKKDSGLRMGIEINGLVSINDFSPFQVGLGSDVQIWIEKPVNQKSGIQLSFGYRKLTGFKRKSIYMEEHIYPEEVQLHIKTKELASLEYLSADVNWNFRTGKKSPWKVGLGARIGKLLNLNGHDHYKIWVRSRTLHLTETSAGGGGNTGVQFNESTPLPENEIKQLDFGILLDLHYQITDGLLIKAGLYQGIQEVFDGDFLSDGKNYRVSTLSFGLSARLF